MSVRTMVSLAVLWVVSLLVVATAVKAQVYEPPRPLPEPRVVAGPDFGFRIESEQSGAAVGKLVVRVNGTWIEARVGSLPGTRPVSPE